MSKFSYKDYVEFRDNHGWDECIEYLEELMKKPDQIPHDAEVNMLIGMYWHAYSLLDVNDPGNPDDNPLCLAIRQFVIEQLDKLLHVETIVQIRITTARPLNSDDEFLIESLLSKELDAAVTITYIRTNVIGD